MNKKILSLLIISIAIISITTVNATEINSSNVEISDSPHENIDLSTNPDDTSNILSDEYDDYNDMGYDGYIVAFYNNTSTTKIKYEEISFNVKNITEYDPVLNDTSIFQLSTFKINGQEYTMVKYIPTSGIFGYPVYVKFNPNEYNIYDGIMYKMENGKITDAIDTSNYEKFDNEYYKKVGISGEYWNDEIYDGKYSIINNECYKYVGTTSPYVIGFFEKAVNGKDYKITDSKYYTLNNTPIEIFPLAMANYYDADMIDKINGSDINGTYFISITSRDYSNQTTTDTYTEEIINGCYLASEDGFHYKEYYYRFAISQYNYVKINETYYKVILGHRGYEEKETYNEEYESKYQYTANEYVLINGELFPFIDEKIADSPVNLSREYNYTIKAPDVTKYYGGSEKFQITLTDENNNPIANKKITITVNNNPYSRTTDNTGQASLPLNLNSGKYTITTECEGVKNYSTIIIKDTVISSDFTKMFKNATQYYGTFLNSQGDAAKNTKVSFNINGKFYTRTTNENGIAKMDINLNAGEYIITATNPITGEKHASKVNVLPIIVENYNLTKYYRNTSQYSVQVLDDTGNPTGKGESVTFNINGVLYTRFTNESGHAKLNINLAPGEYIITAEYKGYKVSNNIKVLPVLSADDLYMDYKDGSQFKAKLIDGQGRAYANQIVTFNINGKFYDRTTNSDGMAKLNINLIPGIYIITSTFNGCSISNEILINGVDEFYYGRG